VPNEPISTSEPVPEASSAAAAEPGPAQPRVSTRKWLRRFSLLLFLAGILYFLRAPLLSGLAGLLIVDEHGSQANWVVPLDGHGHYEQVARLCREHAETRVLLIRLDPSRLEALARLPSGVEVAQRDLDRRGIQADRVAVFAAPGRPNSDWVEVRCLGQWLAENPDAQITLICDRFRSRHKRMILDRVLPPADAARVRLWPVAHPWYDETNWWRRKEGALDTFNGFLGVGFTWFCGDTSDRWQSWDPDEFERTLEAAP
jgi:hypothetical protein